MLEHAEQLIEQPLRIGISTRALFRLEEEHKIFVADGVQAYEKLQLERENILVEKGAAFEVVDRLLKLNRPDGKPFVEVILLSRNSPNLSLRAFNSVESYSLDIKTGSFTSGRRLAPYVQAWKIDLFLSNEIEDVEDVVTSGTAAARLGSVPASHEEIFPDEVRIAFDGDAVLFSAESDRIYKDKGLQAFLHHERTHAREPMQEGPLGKFLKKLSLLRKINMREDGRSKVRIAVVTARNAPAHAHVVHTLRAWDTPADEAHFVGHNAKSPVLAAFAAHIFFDDQEKHVMDASAVVAAGHVPGPHASDELVIPAG